MMMVPFVARIAERNKIISSHLEVTPIITGDVVVVEEEEPQVAVFEMIAAVVDSTIVEEGTTDAVEAAGLTTVVAAVDLKTEVEWIEGVDLIIETAAVGEAGEVTTIAIGMADDLIDEGDMRTTADLKEASDLDHKVTVVRDPACN